MLFAKSYKRHELAAAYKATTHSSTSPSIGRLDSTLLPTRTICTNCTATLKALDQRACASLRWCTAVGCLYSPRCRDGFFPETGLLALPFLGNSKRRSAGAAEQPGRGPGAPLHRGGPPLT